jgi:hypothetical protein
VTPLRLYLDEDAQEAALAEGLRHHGLDVLTARDAGMTQRSDDDYLEFSTQESRTLFSFNIPDFRKLHAKWIAEGRPHAGIIVAQQQRYSVKEQIRRLVRLANSLTAEDIEKREEFLSAW